MHAEQCCHISASLHGHIMCPNCRMCIRVYILNFFPCFIPFSVVIFISTIEGVVLKLCTYMLFTYMHFVIYVMFNVLYRSRLSCHVGEINAGFELFGHGTAAGHTPYTQTRHTCQAGPVRQVILPAGRPAGCFPCPAGRYSQFSGATPIQPCRTGPAGRSSVSSLLRVLTHSVLL